MADYYWIVCFASPSCFSSVFNILIVLISRKKKLVPSSPSGRHGQVTESETEECRQTSSFTKSHPPPARLWLAELEVSSRYQRIPCSDTVNSVQPRKNLKDKRD
ncbi:hypothetical protein BJX62DRAFT_121392 [Aspergillus germanicus]